MKKEDEELAKHIFPKEVEAILERISNGHKEDMPWLRYQYGLEIQEMLKRKVKRNNEQSIL